jgi:hypothetical protein
LERLAAIEVGLEAHDLATAYAAVLASPGLLGEHQNQAPNQSWKLAISASRPVATAAFGMSGGGCVSTVARNQIRGR